MLLYQLTHVISAGSFLNFAFLYAFLSFCSDSEPYLIRSIPAAGCFEEGLESPPPSYNSSRSTPLTTPAADHLEEDLETLPSYESCTSPSTLSTGDSHIEKENPPPPYNQLFGGKTENPTTTYNRLETCAAPPSPPPDTGAHPAALATPTTPT